jgi:hypothetical protein
VHGSAYLPDFTVSIAAAIRRQSANTIETILASAIAIRRARFAALPICAGKGDWAFTKFLATFRFRNFTPRKDQKARNCDDREPSRVFHSTPKCFAPADDFRQGTVEHGTPPSHGTPFILILEKKLAMCVRKAINRDLLDPDHPEAFFIVKIH